MKKAAWEGGIFQKISLLILVLALLVGDAAAGLAGRLAGGLALAAAAVLGALAQIAGLDGLNMLHGKIPPGLFILFIECTMFCRVCQSVFAAGKRPAKALLGGVTALSLENLSKSFYENLWVNRKIPVPIL